MRLIDSDELIEMAYRMRLDSREQIACMIESAPTIGPERKRGKWIWDDFGYHCSECYYHVYGNTGEVLSGEYKFCPHCGAEMEGDADE